MIAQWEVVEHVDAMRAAFEQVRAEFDAGQIAQARERLRQLHLQVGLLHAATSAGVKLDNPNSARQRWAAVPRRSPKSFTTTHAGMGLCSRLKPRRSDMRLVILSAMVAAALVATPAFASTTDALKAATDKASEQAKKPKTGADAGTFQVAELHLDVTRGNAIKRGWFNEELAIAISESGVEYTAPGSGLEKHRGQTGQFGGHLGRTTCDDGQPVRYLYNWPGSPDCAADRPQR